MPQRLKHRWRISFTLRTFFALITVTTIFAGWRYNQRTHFQVAARKIQERGGTIFYHWQDPAVGSLQFSAPKPNRGFQEYQVTLPDGSIETKTRQVPKTDRDYYYFSMNALYAKCGNPPGFQLFDFLCGNHNDFNIAAISLPATAVDQEMISLLSEIPELEKLLLEVGPWFSKAEVARQRGDPPSDEFAKCFAELRRTAELVQKHLPEVSLNDRGAPPIPE